MEVFENVEVFGNVAVKKAEAFGNVEVFGNVAVKKVEAIGQVALWDGEQNLLTLTVKELDKREEARRDFKSWALAEEIHWWKNFKEVWLKERDKNTRFFHQMANAHRRRNQMSREGGEAFKA